MLKELLHLWKKSSIMAKAVESFGTMLDDCAYIFCKSCKVFRGQLSFENEKDDIHTHDKEVNSKERDIRRLLLEHLTVNPGEDASGCLALMSMVKDAERIGDYSKNLFDIVIMVEGKTGELKYMSEIELIRQKIEDNLNVLSKAFVDSDEKLARQILESYLDTKQRCNKILNALFVEDIPKQEALITVLIIRYLKRINSHVSNVASGIIFPLDKIDFVRGGLLE